MPSKRTPPPKVNEKGEILSLLAASPDGRELKMYVESGAIGNEMTPGSVREKYPQYKKYEYNSFSGALRRARNVQNKQVTDRSQMKNGCKLCVCF